MNDAKSRRSGFLWWFLLAVGGYSRGFSPDGEVTMEVSHRTERLPGGFSPDGEVTREVTRGFFRCFRVCAAARVCVFIATHNAQRKALIARLNEHRILWALNLSPCDFGFNGMFNATKLHCRAEVTPPGAEVTRRFFAAGKSISIEATPRTTERNIRESAWRDGRWSEG